MAASSQAAFLETMGHQAQQSHFAREAHLLAFRESEVLAAVAEVEEVEVRIPLVADRQRQRDSGARGVVGLAPGVRPVVEEDTCAAPASIST